MLDKKPGIVSSDRRAKWGYFLRTEGLNGKPGSVLKAPRKKRKK